MVRNSGTETLKVSGVTTDGPFAVSSTAGFELAPDGSKSLSVTFSPTSEGSLSGMLTFSSNDPSTPAATVNLSGSGVKPMLAVTPSTSANAPLDFGEQRVNTPSVAREVTLSNTGSGPITINTVSVAPPFSVVTSGSFSLASGANKDALGDVHSHERGRASGLAHPHHGLRDHAFRHRVPLRQGGEAHRPGESHGTRLWLPDRRDCQRAPRN